MAISSSRLTLSERGILLAVAGQAAFLLLIGLAGRGGATPVLAASAAVARQPVLVELFTSEGCSSCPPADALLAQIDRAQSQAGSQPVIVLSEHVTYWNDGGWHDPYSSEFFTERQRTYAAHLADNEVYTPEAVVDGAEGLVGSDRDRLLHAIDAAASKPKTPITLTEVHWEGGSVSAMVTADNALGTTELVAALADNSDSSNVLRGENGGRGLVHVAVVRSLVELRKVTAPLDHQLIQIKLPGGVQPQPKMRLVVLLVDLRTGRVRGATQQLIER